MDSRERRTKSSQSSQNSTRKTSRKTNQKTSGVTDRDVNRKRRTVQKKREDHDDIQYVKGNIAKSSPASRRRQARIEEERRTTKGAGSRNRRRGRQTAAQKSNAVSKNIGITLAIMEAVASMIFAVAVIQLNMLPLRYVGIMMGLLILLGVLLFIGQLFSKKNAITGKIVSILLIISLLFGSFYIFKASGTLSSITGGDLKVDHMVVAVMDSNPAETIEDVADYTFGAQYAMSGEDVEEAIEAIEEELGSAINVIEYDSMQSLAVALQTGEVQAIVYNEAHSSFVEDENPDFETDIRIIYTYEIATTLSLSDVETANIAVQDESFIVYISGIDVYGDITKNSRSDVNILVQVNPTTHEVLLINTPRDFYVQFPEVTGDSYDKLTHAGIYGVDTSIATLEELYDIDIDFYARVNFTSLIEMVDALGGITVYSEYAFTTIIHAGLYALDVQAGYNEFDGTDALIFARERYNVPGGDNQRGINQQEVIKAMIEKATSPAIITGAYSILESVSGNVDTNMTDSQIQDLIKQQINQGIEWNIESVSATGTASSEYCYSSSSTPLYVTIPDYDAVELISQQIEAVASGGTIYDVEETETETEE